MATLYAKAAGGNWSAAGTWSNTGSGGGDSSGPPTAADDCILDAGSGNVTIDAAAVARSLDCTGYTGVLTHNLSVALTLGDGTAGAGNIALKLVAGMTYTLGNAITSSISFVSTSATQQTIDVGGKTTGNMVINGAGSSYLLSGALSAGVSTSLTLTAGALDTNNQSITYGTFASANTNTRSLTLGSSAIAITGTGTAWNTATITGLTLNSGTSVITLSGAAATFSSGTLTWYSVVFTGTGATSTSQGGATVTFTNFTKTGAAETVGSHSIGGPITVTGTFTCNGNSATNRVLFSGNTLGTSRTVTAATVAVTNADFRDITGAGAGSWDLSAITGKSGDCGGNSGITFTTAVQKFWVGNAGSYSDPTNHWATSSGGAPGAANLPLPQDDVRFDANSVTLASQTITVDMPRVGKSIDLTGMLNSPTINITANPITIFGSLTRISAMSVTGTTSHVFEGRGSFTLTLAGTSFTNAISMNMVGGTMTLQDAFSHTTAGTFTINNGTFVTNGFSVTTRSFNSANTNTRAMTLGASTFTNTGSAACMSMGTTTNLTFNAGTSTLAFTDTSATLKGFIGTSSLVWNDMNVTGGGAGSVDITGSMTFRAVTIGHPKTINWNAGDTFTIKRLVAMGQSGSLITMQSDSAGSPFTFSQTGGVTACDWLVLQDSTASGTGIFYAGSNSTNVSGNTGWIFKQLTGLNASAF